MMIGIVTIATMESFTFIEIMKESESASRMHGNEVFRIGREA